MLIDKGILSKTMSLIVSPHGLTDYIHAKKFGYLQQLYKINLATVTCGELIGYFHCDYILHTVFLLSSIVHFRNDMPEITIFNVDKRRTQYILSALFVLSLYKIPIELFVIYMVFIHTPNHYKMSWFYIKDNLKETLILVLGFGFALLNLDYLNNLSFPIIYFIQGIIISHIIYQETFVFDNFDKKKLKL